MCLSFLRRMSMPILALAAISAACGDDDPPAGPTTPSTSLTGTWIFTVDITVETGVCEGDNEPTWEATLEFTQTDNAVTAVGDWNSNPGSGPHTFGGTISGSQLVLDGSYPDGTGTTLALYQLVVAQDGNSMTGTETWTWIGDEGTCHDSQSTVVANRLGPD